MNNTLTAGASLKEKVAGLEALAAAVADEMWVCKLEVEALLKEKELLENELNLGIEEAKQHLITDIRLVEDELRSQANQQQGETARLQQQITKLKGEKTALQQQLLLLNRKLVELESQVGA